MRATFDFIGVQDLGYWGHGGLRVDIIGGLFNSQEWKWRLPAWNPKPGIMEVFENQGFREYLEACGKGGDLLLFSDLITVDGDEKIQLTS